MPRFRYKARGGRGDLVTGVLESPSADAVAAQLLNSGVVPIEIEQDQPGSMALSDFGELLTRRAPDLDDLILFSRQMYSLSKAGVPIIRGLKGLADSSRNPFMARALHDTAASLETGQNLASSMASHKEIFPALLISMIRVGEDTGRLDEAFMRLAKYLELEKDTRERIKSALRYPTLVIVAISVALGVINVMVIPAFAKVFERAQAELPLATRILISTSDFAVAWWHYIGLALVAAAVGAHFYMQTEQGRYRWDKWKLRIPIVGDVINRAILARFARSFALSLRSGVPLIQGLAVVARAVGNEYLADHVLRMRNGIERGDTLTRTAASTGLFTPMVLQMLAVGEETGQVDELLDEVAEFYEREVDYDLKNLSSAIEPILIVAVGIMVLILAMGVFLPMWDLATTFKR